MSMEDVCSCPIISVCVNVINSLEIVCLIIMTYITIYLNSKPSSNIDKKSPLFTPSSLLCNGEVITKGSNCVFYVTLYPTIKIAHCKNSSLCE